MSITAEDKAKELYFAMLNEGKGLISDYLAKQCALIAVEEILSVLFQHHEIDYWKEVKTEIGKL